MAQCKSKAIVTPCYTMDTCVQFNCTCLHRRHFFFSKPLLCRLKGKWISLLILVHQVVHKSVGTFHRHRRGYRGITFHKSKFNFLIIIFGENCCEHTFHTFHQSCVFTSNSDSICAILPRFMSPSGLWCLRLLHNQCPPVVIRLRVRAAPHISSNSWAFVVTLL